MKNLILILLNAIILTAVGQVTNSGLALSDTAKGNKNIKVPANLLGQFEQEMVLVSGGAFNLGCGNVWGSICFNFEKRIDTGLVNLNSFYISKYDVTQEQWEAVMGENPSYFKGCKKCPVENVSWLDAQEFIKRINKLTGRQYRLPTSAEWEYAARGGNKNRGNYFGGNQTDVAWNELTEIEWQYVMGSKLSNFKNCGECKIENFTWKNATDFVAKLNQDQNNHYRVLSEAEYQNMIDMFSNGFKFSGSNNLDEVAWYYTNSNYSTHPVGQKHPNQLGLYDMNGNVSQWCNDWFGMDTSDYDYSPPPSYFGNNPRGPQSGKRRVVRGASWWMNVDFFRVTMLYGWEPDYRFSDVGFRIARDF